MISREVIRLVAVVGYWASWRMILSCDASRVRLSSKIELSYSSKSASGVLGLGVGRSVFWVKYLAGEGVDRSSCHMRFIGEAAFELLGSSTGEFYSGTSLI